MKSEITRKAIEALSGKAKADGRTLFLYDTKLRRFGARGTRTGEVSYIL